MSPYFSYKLCDVYSRELGAFHRFLRRLLKTISLPTFLIMDVRLTVSRLAFLLPLFACRARKKSTTSDCLLERGYGRMNSENHNLGVNYLIKFSSISSETDENLSTHHFTKCFMRAHFTVLC